MPARAPETITDERERELYRQVSRLFEDFCGDNPDDYVERELSFINVINCAVDTITKNHSSDEEFWLAWKRNMEGNKPYLGFQQGTIK